MIVYILKFYFIKYKYINYNNYILGLVGEVDSIKVFIKINKVIICSLKYLFPIKVFMFNTTKQFIYK